MPGSHDLGSIDLTNFSVGAMLRAGVALRRDLRGVGTMEEAAQLAVSYFHAHCAGPAGERACALVRCYKTHEYGELSAPLKRIADRQLGSVRASEAMRCLVLLATVGDVPAWNAREHSQSHQVIPLPNAEMVRRTPMILRLIEEMGLDVNSVVAGSPEPERGDTRSYDVFHVEEARGSPHIPAQCDFVEPYAIRSVVGFGGLLRSGELFAAILFSRVRIPPESAARFRTLALDLRSVLFQFDEAHTWRR